MPRNRIHDWDAIKNNLSSEQEKKAVRGKMTANDAKKTIRLNYDSASAPSVLCIQALRIDDHLEKDPTCVEVNNVSLLFSPNVRHGSSHCVTFDQIGS